MAGGPFKKTRIKYVSSPHSKRDWYIDTKFVIRGSKRFRHMVYSKAINIVCYAL
jgi:hypothetical protein